MANKEGVARNVEHKGVFYQFLVGSNGLLTCLSRTGSNLKLEDETGWNQAGSELKRLGYRGNY